MLCARQLDPRRFLTSTLGVRILELLSLVLASSSACFSSAWLERLSSDLLLRQLRGRATAAPCVTSATDRSAPRCGHVGA